MDGICHFVWCKIVCFDFIDWLGSRWLVDGTRTGACSRWFGRDLSCLLLLVRIGLLLISRLLLHLIISLGVDNSTIHFDGFLDGLLGGQLRALFEQITELLFLLFAVNSLLFWFFGLPVLLKREISPCTICEWGEHRILVELVRISCLFMIYHVCSLMACLSLV